MSRLRRRLAWGLTILLGGFTPTWAQQITPGIGYVFPAGGRRGTTFQVTVGGRYLDQLQRVSISGSGVEARILYPVEPMKSADVSALRQKLTQFRRLPREKHDAKVRMEMARRERKLALYLGETGRRRAQPAIGEAVALEVTISQDAPVGVREMRVHSTRGTSNPIRFCVDALPEFREQPPDMVPEPPDFAGLFRFPPRVTTDITLPAIVNGQIVPRDPDYVHWQMRRFTPGDADRYRFAARKGQRLLIAAQARQLIPYLADAVPGWFQATLALYDEEGNELAYCDDYRFEPDPVLFFDVPEDGQYVVEIRDAIHRGRPDFVYRIRIGELPFISSIFPLGGSAGEKTTVELTGWNLPENQRTFDATGKGQGIYALSVGEGPTASNSVPFAVDTLPEALEREPNDSSARPQHVRLPVIVNGRVDRPGDWDVFLFQGRAGQEVVLEVTARRLGTPLDSVLELTAAAGKRVAFNDDHQDRADAFHTHHADSRIQVALAFRGNPAGLWMDGAPCPPARIGCA